MWQPARVIKPRRVGTPIRESRVMYEFSQLIDNRDRTVLSRIPALPLDTLEIRALDESHAEAFRMLRLHAFRELPDGFSPTYVEERDRPWEDYFQRFRAEWISGDNLILGAFLAGQLVGAIALRRCEREKQRHKGYIWIFFVEPAARRDGIGRHLLSAALEYARGLSGLQQVQLSVSAGSQSARSLYVSCGFEPFGCERRALKVPSGFVDLELMVLHFS